LGVVALVALALAGGVVVATRSGQGGHAKADALASCERVEAGLSDVNVAMFAQAAAEASQAAAERSSYSSFSNAVSDVGVLWHLSQEAGQGRSRLFSSSRRR
jgi:hypothetical protein